MSVAGLLPVARVAVPALSGVLSIWAGIIAVRQFRVGNTYASLTRPFTALAAAFGVAGLGYAAIRYATDLGASVFPFSLFLIIIPWTVLALRYAGAGRFVTQRRVIAGVVLITAVTMANLVLFAARQGWVDPTVESLESAESVVLLGILTLIFAITSLVLIATYRHEQLSLVHGTVVVLPVIGLIFGFQATLPSTPLVNDILIAGVYVTVAVTLVGSVSRYEVVSNPPSIRSLGERAALTETDEAIFVVDNTENVVSSNRSADHLFGEVSELQAVVDLSISTLVERENITCWTVRGRRQFDPRVSSVTNKFGETLGYTVTLIDVTDRELRRQRLQVLNRILRHNVRNQLDVISAHAEDANLSPVLDSADRLKQLSEDARQVEKLVQRSQKDSVSTAVDALVEDVVDDVITGTAADVTVEVPKMTIYLDRDRCRYALRNIVGNAIEHNDTDSPRVVVHGAETETGVRIVVKDNGPGIPESERTVIEDGSEDPLSHASSLGLWGTNWAVQTMGGSVTFTNSDIGGAAVIIELPDQSES